MTQLPTLDETLAVQPEQLTGLTPIEVDRYNMVLSDEYRRLGDEIDKACDRLYGALLLSKESVRRGRGHARVWPISLEEAEKRAAEHLESGYEPEQRARLLHNLMRDGAYAEQLRAAVGRLAALRAERTALNEGPKAVLDGEFNRRGGWTRMYLCTSDGGHIHTGRRCPSIGPRTPLVWLPEVSGMDWREAYKLVIRDMTAGTEAIMCSKKTCFPDAPVEWTQRQAPETECPGSRQYARLMDPRMANRVHRWAECHVCHEPRVTVTSGGNLRKHDRRDGGEETTAEAPAPQPPAADKPSDDNRLTIIERTPLQAPPAAEEAPKGKPGGNPTVVHVAKFLNAAGFQLSRYTGRMGDRPAGARTGTGPLPDSVGVSWHEDFDSSEKRLRKLGLDNFGELPTHPEDEQRVRDYAEALSPRYHVEVSPPSTPYSSTKLIVTARKTLPVRPKGLPSAAAVFRALYDPSARWEPHVVDQHDHIRVAVKDEDGVAPVRAALEANGWTFEEPVPAVEHYLFYVTGSAPDRRARLRKLRAERERRATELAGRAAVAKVEAGIRQTKAAEGAASAPQEGERAPLGAYVAWAEGPQERTEHGYVVGESGTDALVMGLDGGLRQMPADIPEEEPEPVPSTYDSKGRGWRQGQRAEFKTADLFLYAGEIIGFGEEDGEKTATILVDTRRAAPATRPPKGIPNTPGKPRPVDPAERWTRPLDKLMRV